MSDDPMFDKFGKVYSPNQMLFAEWETGDSFFLIKTGRVRISKIIDGHEKILDEFKAGDVFGEMAILEAQPRNASAQAVDTVTAYRYTKSTFEVLIKGKPQIGIRMLKTFAQRIFDAKRRIQIIRNNTPEDKVMDTLLMLAERNGANNESNIIEIQSTEEDIANWCGVPTEDAKKILRNYANSGRIGVSKNKITVYKYKEMSRYMLSKRRSAV